MDLLLSKRLPYEFDFQFEIGICCVNNIKTVGFSFDGIQLDLAVSELGRSFFYSLKYLLYMCANETPMHQPKAVHYTPTALYRF